MTTNGGTFGSPKENLRATRILFIALVAGMLTFSIIIYFVNKYDPPLIIEEEQRRNVLAGIVVLVALICLLAATVGYRKALAEARNLTGSLNDKLNFYRSTLVRYLALCEGPAIFSAIVYMITGEGWLFGVTAVMLAAMLGVMPTTKRVANDLNLDWKEQKELE